jgi:hypothetical protein
VEDRRVAAAAVLARARKLPSSKKPVRVRARVMTAWATPSPSSNRGHGAEIGDGAAGLVV